MAVYNGEKYLESQLSSILPQLGLYDQIIVVNDCSQDQSMEIIKNMKDSRIKVIENDVNLGVIRSFERAIKASTGAYIFLSDQDDIWHPKKVERVLDAASKVPSFCIVSDAKVVDENLNVLENSFFQLFNSGRGVRKNFVKNTYLGCCMSFDSRVKEWILPFPKNIPIHDHWMGLIIDAVGGVYFLPEALTYYRRHGKNVTSLSRFGLMRVIKNRVLLLISMSRVPKLWVMKNLLGKWRTEL